MTNACPIDSTFEPVDDPFLTSPEFLGAVPADTTPVLPPSGPSFLADDWDEEDADVVPTLIPVTGGQPLLYDGESHLIFGAGGTGKSWIGYYAVKCVVESGGIALILDYESNKRTVKARLKAMGVTREQADRVAYWSLTGSLFPKAETGKAFRTWVMQWCPSFVLLDSVSKALSAAGLKENDNDDFNALDANFMMWLTSLRITNLSVDHTGHEGEGGKPRTKARGASSKDQRMSGVSYHFEAVEHWTRNNSGLGKLTTGKEREGPRKSGSVAAEMVVTVSDEGRKVDINFRAPTPNASGGRRYTWYMEFISQLLTDDGPQTGYGIEKAVKAAGKSKEYADAALKSLVAEGFVSISIGTRNSKVHTVEKAYTAEAESDTDDRHPAASMPGI